MSYVANVANNWALKVLRVFGATILTIHVDLPCYTILKFLTNAYIKTSVVVVRLT